MNIKNQIKLIKATLPSIVNRLGHQVDDFLDLNKSYKSLYLHEIKMLPLDFRGTFTCFLCKNVPDYIIFDIFKYQIENDFYLYAVKPNNLKIQSKIATINSNGDVIMDKYKIDSKLYCSKYRNLD